MVDFNNINTIDLFVDDNILLINQDSSIFTKDNLQREAEKVGIPKSDIKYGIKQIKSTLEQRLNNLTQLESIHEQNNYDKEKTLKQVMERNKLLKRGVLDKLDNLILFISVCYFPKFSPKNKKISYFFK